MGLFLGCFLLNSYNPVTGFLDTIAVYFMNAWTDLDNGQVISV
jgi:hypothetical protein